MAGALATIRFGISRAHGDANLVVASHALSAALERATGEPVQLRVAASYAALYEMVMAGALEVAWLPPLLCARLIASGATPRRATLAAVPVRKGAVTYRSALLVENGARFASLADISNARAAWIDRDSAAGYVFPRAFLRARGVGFVEETFLGSAAAVCAAVADGRADVGATHVSEASVTNAERMREELERQYPAARWRLRVLDITDPIPADGIVIAGHVGRDARNRICKALLTLHETEAGGTAIAGLLNAECLTEPTAALRAHLARAQASCAQT